MDASFEELNFYKVNKRYVDFLYEADVSEHGFSCVPRLDYDASKKEKFMCGIVLRIGEYKYLAPISSYTRRQNDNILLYDSNGNVTSSIRLNFMFPIAKNEYYLFNYEVEVDERYKSVVRRERQSANEQRKKIRQRAAKTYYTVVAMVKRGCAPIWACNFQFLERKCLEWEEAHAKK